MWLKVWKNEFAYWLCFSSVTSYLYVPLAKYRNIYDILSFLIDICPAGYYSTDNFYPCRPCVENKYYLESTMSCTSCPNEGSTLGVVAVTDVNQCYGKFIKTSYCFHAGCVCFLNETVSCVNIFVHFPIVTRPCHNIHFWLELQGIHLRYLYAVEYMTFELQLIYLWTLLVVEVYL